MSRDKKWHDQSNSVVNRRDVLKTAAGATVVGSLGTLSAGTASAVSSFDAAFLVDDCDLNLYHHQDQAEYSATDNRTYHTYQAVDPGGSSSATDGTDGDAYIVAYDHADGSVEGPVRIGLNPLNSNDTHGVPALTIDGDGFLHVFFGSHGGYNQGYGGGDYDDIQYARSESAYDISSWIYPPDGSDGPGPLPTAPGTYTCATYDPNGDAVYVLYRDANHDIGTLAESDDNGQTWTDVNDGVLNFSDSPWDHTDAYVCDLGAWAGRIHMTWMIAESDSHGQPRRHVYHAAYNPSTGNVETMSGSSQGSTVSHADAENSCKVKDTTDIGLDDGGSVGGYNHAYDASSDTAYIPVRYPVDSSTSQLRVLSYQGVSTQSGSWQESSRITTTNNPGNLNVRLRVNDSGDLEVTDQDGANGLWIRESGTWNHYDTTSGTSEIDKIQRPVQHGTDEVGWIGRTIKSQNGASRRDVYALGTGQPAGAGASYPRAPRNLRVTGLSGTTVTIDWDDGIAGPSGVERYRVYVDGTQAKDVTDTPNGDQPYPRTWTTVDVGSGEHDIEVSLVNNNSNESPTSNAVTVDTDGGSQSPYGGTPWSIPGRIEAEDFDEGGEGVAYHDTTSGQEGSAPYRSDEDVDISTSGTPYAVGWTADGEWLEYTVDVDSAGTYDLDLRVCSNDSSGATVHFEFDGTDVTGSIDIPSNGSWSEYQTITETDIGLDAGEQVMRLAIDSASFNIDWIEWSSSGGSSSPTPVTRYAFDEGSGASTATDSAGNHDASVNGGVTTGVGGQDGSAYDFDGSSTATVVDADAENYINGLSEITVSAWVQSDSTGNDRGIFNGATDGGDGADSDVCLRYDSTGWESGNTNCIKAAVRYDDGSGTVSSAQVETEGGVQTTSWQHVVYTWSAGDQVRVYVDGSEVNYGFTQSTPSGATIDEQTAFAVGEAVHSNTWDGKIDDVRVYDQAFSSSEVATLYNSY